MVAVSIKADMSRAVDLALVTTHDHGVHATPVSG